MEKRSYRSSVVAVTATLGGLLVALLMASPALAADKLPEVSSDGLHLVKSKNVRIAYVKPGATLGPYHRVMLVDCFVDFVANWQRDYNMNELGLEGRVTDLDAQKIKQGLAEEFKKVFTDELTKKGYPVVDTPAPDVLLLRPALINVDVTAPDIDTPDMRRTFVRSAGDMTLYMEMYDSATSTLLARVIDPQADDEAFARQANRVTNRAAADFILHNWAALLVKRLDDVKEASSK